MSLKALVYAYVLGGFTFIPLVIVALIGFTIYTSVPVGDIDPTKDLKAKLEWDSEKKTHEDEAAAEESSPTSSISSTDDIPRTRKGWLTMRRTFEESTFDGSYVTLVRSFLDARSKDPKRSRPKDMWYVVLKGKVLYLYEDEGMTECEAVLELGGHDVLIYPEGLTDGELFAKRNAICLRPKPTAGEGMSSVTREMKLESDIDVDSKAGKEKEKALEDEKKREVARDAALSLRLPWFIFVRTNVEMEDWYLSLVHASDNPANHPTLAPLAAVFLASDMNHLVSTLDEQPDVIPMRWLNALIGRLFFSYYRTQVLESYIIGRLMKKLSKVKRPAFLTDIVVTEVSVGNTAPTFSKPMLKELTKEGDASLEVQLRYKGEVRITIEATATINLGARFKSYTVKLVLAAVLREIEGNLLVKVKRPPSNRIWYAFTAPPKIVLDVEPIVSDRQITWGMILNTIESRLKEIIQESVVMPNMDDIAFFESSQYIHRGGIWGDATRRERAATSVSQTSQDDATSSMSAPVVDISGSVTTAEPELVRSHSAENLATDTGPPLEGVPMGRSATQEANNDPVISVTSTGSGSTTNTTRNRRRTWFSSVGSADLGPLKDEIDTQNATFDLPRGRSTETDNQTAPRSKSTPESPHVEKPIVEEREESPDHLSPHRPPRSSSRHSPSPSSTSSGEEEPSHPSESPNRGQTLFRTPSSSSRAKQVSPGSPSSFLSTLKSRAAAADKQALSNQAKEAMRKWGVNWGGLRRDGSGGSGSSVPEDLPDVGPSEARVRTDSNDSSKRASYAEVRAAVAERKEREKNGIIEPSVPAPVAIPDEVRVKGRSVSISSGNVQVHPPSPSISAVSMSPPSLSKTNSSSTDGSSLQKTAAPSISRSSNNSHSNDPFIDRDLPETDDKRSSPAPVRTQPSYAKTMTIPGIHASHRGEVMSMGFVAPPPPPPSKESSIKAPAMQSVYRLWKSPTLSGQQPQESEAPSQVQATDSSEHNGDVAPLSLSPESNHPSRPLPPPLPPRSHTSGAISILSDTPPSIAERAASPASEALKYIATKDENQRSPPGSKRNSSNDGKAFTETLSDSPTHDDLFEQTLSNIPVSKPPLPPRKIPTSS